MFTAFIKILPVGELPSHTHGASVNVAGEHTHNYTTYQYLNWHGSKEASSDWMNISTGITSKAGNHSHTITVNNTGSNTAHNNLQPYYACYIWRRTA